MRLIKSIFVLIALALIVKATMSIYSAGKRSADVSDNTPSPPVQRTPPTTKAAGVDAARADRIAEARERAAQEERAKKLRAEAEAKNVALAEENVEILRRKGMIYSIDVKAGEVRVEPAVWARQNVDTKKEIVQIFDVYFKAKAGPGIRTQIKSNKNDTIFAESTVFSGIQVYF